MDDETATTDVDEAYGQVDLVPDQGEDETDLADAPETFRASVSAKDWTVETLVSQMRKGRIDLAPSFQRRSAWLNPRKSKLIESIMLGFPIPQIVLAENHDKPGYYFVIDGKQRLLALRQFFADTRNSQDAEFLPLKLTGLEVLTEQNRRNHADLEKLSPELAAEVENHTIRTVVLSDWNSERMLLTLFLRLNTGSVTLSPQELRQALIPGQFIKWLDQASGESLTLRRLLNNSHADRRMVDAELLLRHLAFSMSPIRYRGNLKVFLDDTCRSFNREWGTQETSARQCLTDFEAAIVTGLDVFGREEFAHKWSGSGGDLTGRFERALNRAVLDVQGYALSFPSVRDAVAAHADDVMDAFKRACVDNDNFIRSISLTTKTVEAFITRHRIWQGFIRAATGTDYPLPRALDRE
jgi:hypothetical protein